MCVSLCNTTLSAASVVSTLKVRYVWVYLRVFSVFNSWIFDSPSVQKLWREKANMQISMYVS